MQFIKWPLSSALEFVKSDVRVVLVACVLNIFLVLILIKMHVSQCLKPGNTKNTTQENLSSFYSSRHTSIKINKTFGRWNVLIKMHFLFCLQGDPSPSFVREQTGPNNSLALYIRFNQVDEEHKRARWRTDPRPRHTSSGEKNCAKCQHIRTVEKVRKSNSGIFKICILVKWVNTLHMNRLTTPTKQKDLQENNEEKHRNLFLSTLHN